MGHAAALALRSSSLRASDDMVGGRDVIVSHHIGFVGEWVVVVVVVGFGCRIGVDGRKLVLKSIGDQKLLLLNYSSVNQRKCACNVAKHVERNLGLFQLAYRAEIVLVLIAAVAYRYTVVCMYK